MRLVITGASGFIGQQIIPVLISNGIDILAVGKSPSELSQLYPELEVCDYEAMGQRAKDASALLHLAVLSKLKFEDLESSQLVNVALLKEVIATCKQANIPQLIYPGAFQADSSASSYSQTKKEAESILDQTEDLTINRLRLPVVYGDGRYRGRLATLNAVPELIKQPIFQIMRSLKPTLHVNRLADAVHGHLGKCESSEVLLTDCQESNWFYHGTKRVFDVTMAIAIVVLLWWLLILVWIVTKISSKGPGIFAQERVGKRGEVFILYKFRTMELGTKQAGTHEVSRASVTTIGHFLRRTKIDELPQIWNVLKGELSFVGPRPCLPTQIELINERRAQGLENIIGGITGYAQVRGVDMSDPKRLANMDATYLKLRTLQLDLKILIQTALGSGGGDRILDT